MGLVEETWLDTIATLPPGHATHQDYVIVGAKLAKQLRAAGAQVIIALTHMRWPSDERLAREVPDIDLVLGGHDHDLETRCVNGTYIVKSGTDFRHFTSINLQLQPGAKPKVAVKQCVCRLQQAFTIANLG